MLRHKSDIRLPPFLVRTFPSNSSFPSYSFFSEQLLPYEYCHLSRKTYRGSNRLFSAYSLIQHILRLPNFLLKSNADSEICDSNKIYQATKYVLGKLDNDFTPQTHPAKTGHESLAELWILHKFTSATSEVNKALTEREFNKATTALYQYWYNYLCGKYFSEQQFPIITVIEFLDMPPERHALFDLFAHSACLTTPQCTSRRQC